MRMKTTKQHETYWRDRKIDWKVSYLDTHSHPHRHLISSILGELEWGSLLEVGCGPGANLVNILHTLKHREFQLGGIDINEDAIKLAQEVFKGGFFKVCPVTDIMMSDSSVDVILSDMTLIYLGGKDIDTAIQEIKRVGRHFVLFSELHSDSFWRRLMLYLRTGYFAHNYKKLLEKHDFYDVRMVKIPPEAWEGGEPQKSFGYFILAKIPKRK